MKPYYQEDGYTVYCGDCLEVLSEMIASDSKFEMVITDPPYNCKKNYGEKTNDNLPWPEWVEWWDEVLDFCFDVSVNGVWCSLSQTAMKKYDRLGGKREVDWEAVWVKPLSMAICASAFMPHWESLPYWGPLRRKKVDGAFLGSNVLTHNVEFGKERWDHKTPKPLALMKDMCSRFKGPILDPFGGSGTTIRACKDLGIKCVTIEIEEKHCETIVKRLSQEVLAL